MAKGKLEVFEIVPTPANASALVRRFGAKKYGVVTSLSDPFLGTLRSFLEESTLVDLKPFGEFVRQVHTQIEGKSMRLASSRQVLTAIGLACEELPDLGPFTKVRDFPGFHECLAEQFRLLQHWSVSPEGQELEGPTGAKLSALFAISKEVEITLNQGESTFASRLMEDCLEQTLDLDGQEARLLVFCRGELHPLAMQWLRWLVAQGAQVEVVVDRHANGADIFRSSAATINLLGAQPKQPGEANLLLNGLFGSGSATGAPLDFVEVHSLGDPFSEAEWAVRTAAELAETQNVTIFARDSDTYLPVLIAASQRLRVPLRLARRTPLASNGFIKSVRSLLALLGTSDVRPLNQLMRTGYLGSGWSQEVAEAIDRAHLEGGDEWQKLAEYLVDSSVLATLEHISHLRSESKAPKSFLDWHKFLRAAIEQAPWFGELSEKSIDGRDQRAFTAMLSALGQDAVVRHSRLPQEVTFDDWRKVLDQLIEVGDASVPKLAEGIDVATSVDDIGLTGVVIAVGLLEGAFPRRRSENPILSDEDLAAINTNPPIQNSFDTAAAERDHFYRLCAAPSRGLILSYPQVDGERDNIPAFYLEEIKRVCGIKSEIVHPRKLLVPDRAKCHLEPDRKLAEKVESEPVPAPRNQLENEASRDLIRFNRSSIRPVDLRYLNECTFRFLATRELPMPARTTDFWGYLLRVPERANLLTAPDRESAERAMGAAFAEVLDGIKPLLPQWELDLLTHGSDRVFRQWIDREFASRELWSRNPLDTRLGGKLADIGNHAIYDDKLAGVTDANGIRTIHLYRRHAPDKLQKQNRDGLFLEYGAMIETAWANVHEVRVEVEGLGDHRTLFVYQPEDEYPPSSNDDLKVINLGRGEATREELRTQLKDLFGKGLVRAKNADMTATPGDFCTRCQVSDLCRRAQGASEEEDIFAEVSDE